LLVVNLSGHLYYTDMIWESSCSCSYGSWIYNNVVSSNLIYGESCSIQHCVIKFVSDLRQVGGFIRVIRFSPPIKLTATI